MARRLTRRVGITQARVNVPDSTSIGPALLKVAGTIAEHAATRGAEIALAEATAAAQALNFERDPAGNVVAPRLPENEGGWVGPSIYDAAYTSQVLTRYKQQIALDGAKQLQLIAENNRFDPQGFEASANAYIQATKTNILEQVRGDAATDLEQRAVTHLNFIVRQRSERDFIEAGNTHMEHLNHIEDNLISLTASGAEFDLVMAEYLRWHEELEKGADRFYYDRSNLITAPESVKKGIVGASLMHELTVLMSNPATHAEAIKRIEDFHSGDATIKVPQGGVVVEIPVIELFETPEERQLIVDAATEMIASRIKNVDFIENQHFSRQNDEFYRWYLPHLIKMTTSGRPVSMQKLVEWAAKAEAEGNIPLHKDIAGKIKELWNSTFGASGTRWQRRMAQADGYVQFNRQRLRDDFFKRNASKGITPENIDDEMKAELEASIARVVGGRGVPQTAQGAEEIDDWYASNAAGVRFGENLMNEQLPLEVIEQWVIDSEMSTTGIIGWDFLQPLNGIFSNASDAAPKSFERALNIARILYDHPAIANNMSSTDAFGRHGQALRYLFDNYAASRINLATAKQIFDDFRTPGYTPHLAWAALPSEDRERMSDMMDRFIDGRYQSFTEFSADGFQIPTQWWTFAPTLARIPAAMEEQLFLEMRSVAGFIDPDDLPAFNRHMANLIHRISSEFGWVPSKLAYSPEKFTGDHDGFWDSRPIYTFSRFGPESFYRTSDGDSIDFELIDEIEIDFQKLLDEHNIEHPNEVRLVAGENASLEYNAQRSIRLEDGRIVPFYNIWITRKNGAPEILEDNFYAYGDADGITFESTRIRVMKRRKEQFGSDLPRRRQQEAERREESKRIQFP